MVSLSFFKKLSLEKRIEQKNKTIKFCLASGVGRFLSGVRESAAGNVTISWIRRYKKTKLRETGYRLCALRLNFCRYLSIVYETL